MFSRIVAFIKKGFCHTYARVLKLFLICTEPLTGNFHFARHASKVDFPLPTGPQNTTSWLRDTPKSAFSWKESVVGSIFSASAEDEDDSALVTINNSNGVGNKKFGILGNNKFDKGLFF